MRSALARRNNRVMPTQKVIPTQTVVIILSLPPEEQESLGAAVNIMNQTIGGRRMMAAAGTKPEAVGTQPEAAVAAMEKVAGQAEAMPPRQTI